MLPFILYDFIDERQQKRINIKVHMLSSLRSSSIKASISSCGMKLLVECRLQSNFVDPQRHRESFRRLDGSFRFSVTDMRMVSFAHISSQLPRGADGLVWAVMKVDLPYKVESEFYDEDVIPGYDLFFCDQGLFLHLQLVGVDRSKAKEEKPLPGIRVVAARSENVSTYDTPEGDHYAQPFRQDLQDLRGKHLQGTSRHQVPRSARKRKKTSHLGRNGTHFAHHFFAPRQAQDQQGRNVTPNFGATFEPDRPEEQCFEKNPKPGAVPVGTTNQGKVLFGPGYTRKDPNENLIHFSPEKNQKNQEEEQNGFIDEISMEDVEYEHEDDQQEVTYNFESDCPQAANLMGLDSLANAAHQKFQDEKYLFAHRQSNYATNKADHLL